MKIAIIYGNSRKGCTYNCVQIVKKTMENMGEVEFKEVFLPMALPQHCVGCFNCILKGEAYCPHSDAVASIINTLLEADGIILASPVYGLDVSGAMKTLIDHLCYMWIPHRPKEEMFSKVGFAISTAAGTGTKRTNKTLKLCLDYLGVRKVFSFGANVAASSWEEVKDNKKKKIELKLETMARKFYNITLKRKKIKKRIFTKFMLKMMKGMISSYKEGNIDKEYWRSMGWIK